MRARIRLHGLIRQTGLIAFFLNGLQKSLTKVTKAITSVHRSVINLDVWIDPVDGLRASAGVDRLFNQPVMIDQNVDC